MKRNIASFFSGLIIFAGSALMLAPPTSTGITQTASASTIEACAHYTNHVYEVCTAYIANSSLAVLWPYYAYAKSSNSTLARYVEYRLGSRYYGQAYMAIKNRVTSWPAGDLSVGTPSIKVLSVTSDLQTNTATMQTIESWKVTAVSGQLVYQEKDVHHTITMARVPSYILHKWVVTTYQ